MAETFRQKIAAARLNLDWWWNRCRCSPRSVGQNAERSLVLIPCEPWTVMGSRGDEAMIYSVLQNFRRRHPEGRITIVTGSPTFAATDDGKRLAKDFSPLVFSYAWRPRWYLSSIVQAIRAAKATEVYVLGADCMDGKWGTYTSTILLASADLATRMGIATRLTAFSWNEHPTPGMLRGFRHVTDRLPILLRDPVSHGRFVKDFPHLRNVKLVTDVAFNLQPKETEKVRRERVEMDADRARGRFVLGFNLHSMLVEKGELESLLLRVAEALRMFIARCPQVQLVFIPHDYRTGGDLEVLRRLYELLPSCRDNIRLVEPVLSAAELKALTAGLDALFTSRMHLGIAALGMGRPVGAFAYQGKFAGLFEHVSLPQELILPPDAAPKALGYVLEHLVANAPSLTAALKERLPDVFGMAKASFIE